MRHCIDFFGVGIACIGYGRERQERKQGVQETVILNIAIEA
jgi:hypothetical protein